MTTCDAAARQLGLVGTGRHSIADVAVTRAALFDSFARTRGPGLFSAVLLARDCHVGYAGDTPAQPPMPSCLTEPEIEQLVERYRREMARYEDAAQLVEDRLRRVLRAGAIRALLSSRAKHPDDLAEKLLRKRNAEVREPLDRRKYTYTRLIDGLDQVVTDLAGCRVMVYPRQDEERVAKLVRDSFSLAALPGSDEVHRKQSGYRGTHLLVRLGDETDRISLRGSICEVQVTTISAHVFNEFEHDVTYKDHGHRHGEVPDRLDDLRCASHVLDSLVDRFEQARAELIRKQSMVLESPEQLRFALENVAQSPLRGDFARLFALLSGVFNPLTVRALEMHDHIPDILARGQALATDRGVGEPDAAVQLALGLLDRFKDEFVAIVGHWKGPTASLKIKDAIQRVQREEHPE